MTDLDYHEHASEVVERMREAYQLVQAHQNTQIERMKRYYNVGVKPRTFKVNDLVYYYYPRKYVGRTPKWARVYDGVYRVEKVLNDVVYIIRKTPTSKAITANVDKLNYFMVKFLSVGRSRWKSPIGRMEKPRLNRPMRQIAAKLPVSCRSTTRSTTQVDRLMPVRRLQRPANAERDRKQDGQSAPQTAGPLVRPVLRKPRLLLGRVKLLRQWAEPQSW